MIRNSDYVIEFIEGFYNYWRGLERYALIQTNEVKMENKNNEYEKDNTLNFFSFLIFSIKFSMWEFIHCWSN